MFHLRGLLPRSFLFSHKNELKLSAFHSEKSSKETFYSILSVDHKADQKDIKDAYLRLSKLWHPDLHQNAEDDSAKVAESKFREILSAYEVLSDPNKRRLYDSQIGLAGPERPSSTSPHGTAWQPFSKWTPGQGRQFAYGVDPAFGRRIEVDLSEERMKKAWEAYKVRWAEEEEQRLILEEKKLNFRIQLDKKREMFDHLSEEEKSDLKESMRLFRNPFEGEKPLGEKYYNGSRNNPFRSQDSLRKNGGRTNIAQQSYTTSSSSKNSEKSGKEKTWETSKSDEEKVKNIYEQMHWQEPDPIFEKFRRNSESDFSNNNNKDDEFNQDFRSSFDTQRDPFVMESSNEEKIKFSQVYQDVKTKTENIKRNWDNSQFLSDTGSPDRPTSLVSVSKPLTYCMVVVILIAFWVSQTCFNDPCEGNIFMEELKERERQKHLEMEEKSKSIENCDPAKS